MSKQEGFDLWQGHGNHFDCLSEKGDEDALIKRLPEMLEKAKLVVAPGAPIPCSLEEESLRQVQCAMLSDTEDFLHLNMLLGCNINGERHMLLSAYPEINGAEIAVTLTEIHEWGNGLEATLEGTICNGEHHIAFFDTRYIARKGKYEIGKTYVFRIGAIAEKCEVLDDAAFKMEGQQAIDFMAKLGEKPNYDEDGKIKSLLFDMSQMVVFFQHSVAYPHAAEFQSPVASVSVLKEWEQEYYFIQIAIVQDEDDNDVSIPLVAKKTFFKNALSPDTPIRGIMYLMGYAL